MKKATLFYFPKSKLIDIVLSVNQNKRHVSLLSFCKEQKELFITSDINMSNPDIIKQIAVKIGYNND